MDRSLMEEIVRRILNVSRPERVILFGSAANGEMGPDSDVDLLVVEPSPDDPRSESARLHRALRGLGLAFDVMVVSKDWFEESKSVIGGVAYPADKYGKVIYEAA